MFLLSLVSLAVIGITLGLDVDCPSKGQHFYAHPTHCSKFIECNDGVLVEQDCFGELVFNPLVGYCDFLENYPCEDSKEGPVGTCPPVNGEFVDFLVDAVSCEVFYMCNWGTPIRNECPSGLHFNPTLCVCDYPHNAGCAAAQHFV